MQVAFEKDSHYFWSAGKDKVLKYWDGDKVSTCTVVQNEGAESEVWDEAKTPLTCRFVVSRVSSAV